jgi:hypothetical protein
MSIRTIVLNSAAWGAFVEICCGQSSRKLWVAGVPGSPIVIYWKQDT